jgi:hypothetical protein
VIVIAISYALDRGHDEADGRHGIENLSRTVVDQPLSAC